MKIKVLDEKAYEALAVYLFVLNKNGCTYILVTEGTGDNLLREDIADGYVDYVNYDIGCFEEDSFVSDDGGMVLSKKMICEMPDRLISMIDQVVDMAVGLSDVTDVYVVSA